MLSALRRTVQEELAKWPVSRKPALRRSDDPEALLATDFPMVADDAAVDQLMAELSGHGWRIWRQGAWLLLDIAVPIPAYHVPSLFHGELGCCIFLLLKYAEGPAEPCLIRQVVKAAECGRSELERLCGQWHAQWAEALREHRHLPVGLLPYLCRAENITKT